jgi:hypothetical protein
MADIPHIVFAAHDGNVCSSQSVRENPYIKRHIQTYLGGILETESRALIAQFSPEMLPSLDRTFRRCWILKHRSRSDHAQAISGQPQPEPVG